MMNYQYQQNPMMMQMQDPTIQILMALMSPEQVSWVLNLEHYDPQLYQQIVSDQLKIFYKYYVPPPPGPYPGITHDEFNQFDIQKQREFQQFLNQVGDFHKRWLPQWREKMQVYLKDEVNYNLTDEEIELMGEQLLEQMDAKRQEQISQLKQKEEQEKLEKEKLKSQETQQTQEAQQPEKKVKKSLKKTSKVFEPEKKEKPKVPIYPKCPSFLDEASFKDLYQKFLNYYQPTTEFTKFPTKEEEKRKEEEKKKKAQEKFMEMEQSNKKKYKRHDQPEKPKLNIKEETVDINNLTIDTTVFIQPDETRLPVNLVFIGHVDAGKSTLCGRILVDLGEISDSEIKKFEMEAKENNREGWWLAYCLDINEEERKKGKTVECGKAFFQTQKKRFTVFDAPGHKNYVPNMIMGACQADVAGLIISAKVGEFESGFEKGGQTQEHAFLAKSLGVEHLIVIITKMDTVQWSEERYNEIKKIIDEFIQKYCQFKTMIVVPIDALNDANIKDPYSQCQWYKGPPLLTLLNDLELDKRDLDGPIRIPVLDKLKDQGQFIFGKVEQGTIVDQLYVSMMPKKMPFMISGIYNSKDERLKYAKAGENVKLKVKNIEEEDIQRGMVICNLETNPIPVTYEFQANVRLLDLPEHKKIFSSGYLCVLHLHCIVEEVEILSIQAVIDPETKKPIKQAFMKSKQEGIATFKVRKCFDKNILQCKNPICLEKYDAIGPLGRFALRDEGRSIGFGEVRKFKPIQKEQKEQVLEQQTMEQ